MLDRPGRSERARDLLALVRTDRASAELAVARLPIEEQLALVCEAPVSRRQDLLQLLPEPERVIPLLPEAELCFTVKAVGLADATWILEYATPDQIVACLDLDAWRGVALERTTLDAWLTALAQTDDEAFAKSALSLDPELLVLYLKDRIDVFVKPPDSEDTGWQPPPGATTTISRRSSGSSTCSSSGATGPTSDWSRARSGSSRATPRSGRCAGGPAACWTSASRRGRKR
jgi:hypothetical protein